LNDFVRARLLAVDLQRDFTRPGGACYVPRSSVGFVTGVLFPFMRDEGLLAAEIVSDYRQPRPGDERDCCKPGEDGYTSELPASLRKGVQWVKCMNSPLWTREGIGDENAEPGLPYQDPGRFDAWLLDHVGPPDEARVVVFGLNADACVLCAVQELAFRGYEVYVLDEGTDVASGDQREKEDFLGGAPFTHWGKRVRWGESKGWFQDAGV